MSKIDELLNRLEINKIDWRYCNKIDIAIKIIYFKNIKQYQQVFVK